MSIPNVSKHRGGRERLSTPEAAFHGLHPTSARVSPVLCLWLTSILKKDHHQSKHQAKSVISFHHIAFWSLEFKKMLKVSEQKMSRLEVSLKFCQIFYCFHDHLNVD